MLRADEVVARRRLFLLDRPAALRARLRPLDHLLLAGAVGADDVHHLRDDLALLLDDDRVADADVLLGDPRGVVHARVGDGRAGQLDRRVELRDRRQLAELAERELDRAELGHRLLGLELVRLRPPRHLGGEPEPLRWAKSFTLMTMPSVS